MSAVIHLPDNPARLRAGMAAVRARAQALRVSDTARRSALSTLLVEMQAGRSTAAAVALAVSTFRTRLTAVQGGAR